MHQFILYLTLMIKFWSLYFADSPIFEIIKKEKVKSLIKE